VHRRSIPGMAPRAPEAPWKVQLLTPVCLVEGLLQTAEQVWSSLQDPDDPQQLTLTAAQLRSLIDTGMMPRTVSRWTMPLMSLIGFIPRDEASTAMVEQLISVYQQTSPVVIYAGPYRIRATLLSDEAEPLADPGIVAGEAEISHLPEQTHSPRIRARLLLLNRHWIYGFHTA